MKYFQIPMQWAALCGLALLSACGGGGGSASPVVPPITPAGANDSIVASSSVASPIQAIVGSTQHISVTFTTDDSKAATNFQITTRLSALPAGWNGPASFSCASVASGNGCMVNLSYAPKAVTSGSVSVSYSYTNNAGTSKTGTLSVDYSATAANNIAATVSPAGQVAVMAGGTQAVSVTFTSDNGQAATNLSADLSALPTGWTSSGSTLTCAQITTGSGCMANLSYAPAAVASGTLVVNYTYTDDSGAARTGSVSVPYAATSHNNAVATATPAGEIDVVINGHQNVAVDFTTDDGNPATALTISSGLGAALPAGWSGRASFSCATFSTGNGCELGLQFIPTQTGTGTVSLGYSYTDNSGAAKTGTVTISSRATADNGVTSVTAPSGTVNAVVGQPAQAVIVTFTSNDGNPISNLSVTNGLTSLPTGWIGPGTFSCTTANTGNGCQLSLSYAPAAAGSGTLILSYGYHANSGAAKTGSVSIAYAATTHNNLVSTASPSGSVSAVVNSDSKPVTLTFNTDDPNPATSFTVTTGLTSLPSGWASTPANAFSCATVSASGAGCQLTLTYAPTLNGSGTVSLGYSYNDDSGAPKTGTATINYASIPGFAYVTLPASGVLQCAISGTDGTLSPLSPCTATAAVETTPKAIAFSGNWAYVAPGAVATDVDVCAVAQDGSGTLSSCTSAHSFTSPDALTVSGGQLYVADSDGANLAYSCTIDSGTGALTACTSVSVGTVNTLNGIAVTASNAYLVDYNGENLSTCAVAQDGTMSNCAQQTLVGTTAGNTAGNTTPTGVAVYGGNLYIGTGDAILLCPISSTDGSATVASCTATGTAVNQSQSVGFAFNNGYGYVSGYGANGGVSLCAIGVTGTLDNCTEVTNTAIRYGVLAGMAVH